MEEMLMIHVTQSRVCNAIFCQQNPFPLYFLWGVGGARRAHRCGSARDGSGPQGVVRGGGRVTS